MTQNLREDALSALASWVADRNFNGIEPVYIRYCRRGTRRFQASPVDPSVVTPRTRQVFGPTHAKTTLVVERTAVKRA